MSEDVATADPALAADAATPRPVRWQLWSSPSGQPAWARPALLVVAALAALAYAWGMANASVEPFYGGAARSMAESWHNFFFGAFDPAGIVTLDKLPGAIWPQALSVRIFGFHIWALVLPQVIEGVLTVLFIYRAVRRLAGPAAGLTAAAVVAATPVTVLLSRGNVDDSLMVLLLVLAADATSAALVSGRLRPLLVAGGWVGLAFQAKMIEAWLVFPALAAAYLLAAPESRLRVRAGHVAAAALVTVLVSLSWMTAVSLVPTHDRPYADGSQNNSVYAQVFDYNGLARIDAGAQAGATGTEAPFLKVMSQQGNTLTSATQSIPASWHRLLSGPFGRDGGWLLPAALVAAGAALYARRRSKRTDPLRAAVVLWGGWWLTLAVFFSVGGYLNSYYVAMLTPGIAALAGVGVAVAGKPPWSAPVRITVVAVAAVCFGYGLYLLHGGAVTPAWLRIAALAGVGITAVLLLLLPELEANQRLPVTAVACAGLLILPAAVSATVVARGMGPFDTPFESAKVLQITQDTRTDASTITAFAKRVEQFGLAHQFLMAVDTSSFAAAYVLATGKEVVPIGGFAGGSPAPTLAAIKSYISNNQVQLFVLPVTPASTDPRVQWVEAHCSLLGKGGSPVVIGEYNCTPADVAQG